MTPQPAGAASRPQAPREDRHARELFWATFARMVLLYFAPLLLLVVFFHLQYRHLLEDSLRAHLAVIAEHQANTFDLFLRERLVNLGNTIDDPTFAARAEAGELAGFLASLQQTSDAFVDLGLVSADGRLVAYVGPVVYTSPVNYRNEDWFQALSTHGQRSVITEIYLGYRDQPHFTIAVRRGEGESMRILRAALSPERLSEYLRTLEGANEVHAAVVSARGILQVTTPRVGDVLRSSTFLPPETPQRGFVPGSPREGRSDFAYAWLSETPWALVVTDARDGQLAGTFAFPNTFFPVTVAVFVLMGVVILVRTRQVVGRQIAAERQEAELSGQLVHAAKLASVGELAAGIAHEINNPLAIIAEEVGVLQDSLDPDLANDDDEPVDLPERLAAIHDAVFRCRDITRKLLTFVRQTEVKVEPHFIREILDEVVDLMLGNELAISNVEVVRDYDYSIPQILTDRNQLIQVFVNLVKNAMDAMPEGGTLTMTTRRNGDKASVAIKDTGCGMTQDQMERVFMPFFTTKDPGKGTGLGLSVSFSIIQSFGGTFYVESAPGKGSTFTVELPLVVK